ncbi:uncharacterized protein [Nicotiana tomentosiformis]|uniref:uncharacterized protein n=1 Tax=Nicotiana tomentosiformis TaxID=4098 RepID=UPI00388C5133
MDYDTKVRSKKPFTWYSLMGANNPKKKVQPPTTASQSDEPATVAAEVVDVPSTSVEPSFSAAAMPPLLSTAPTAVPSTAPTSALKPVPMPTVPLSALQFSQKLASLNNWMQTATTKLSDLSNVVAAQSSVQAPQFPPTVEETLKKLLENQNTIMATLVQHGSLIEELGKEVKKMRISQASKKSVDKLQKEVHRIATVGDLPFDMLLDPHQSAPDPAAPSALVAPTGQSDEPDLATDTAEAVREMFANPATPRVEDDDIQLVEPEGDDIVGDTEMSKEL